jgi:hypothetical protein
VAVLSRYSCTEPMTKAVKTTSRTVGAGGHGDLCSGSGGFDAESVT